MQGEAAALKNPWTLFDLIVLAFGFFALWVPLFRFCNAFRAISLLSKFEGTRCVFFLFSFFLPLSISSFRFSPFLSLLFLIIPRIALKSVLQVLRPIFNVVVVISLVFLFFAILGVQIWKGAFSSCTDPSIRCVRQLLHS